jgi:hypothetical protein
VHAFHLILLFLFGPPALLGKNGIRAPTELRSRILLALRFLCLCDWPGPVNPGLP